MNVAAIHRKKIAIVGSGISGLSCAWLLNQVHDITLFEKDERLGGHSNTVRIDDSSGQPVDVDTGFIVYNPKNYPNLVRFFEHLDVDSAVTDMSFSVSLDQGALEYSGCGFAGLFAQRRNLLRPGFWTLLKDLRRFYLNAGRYSSEPEFADLTLGQLLQKRTLQRCLYLSAPGADGRCHMVNAGRPDAQLSGPDLSALLPEPRPGAAEKSPPVAHRAGRQQKLRR
ncbi:FAD-dependent oxidoreductase [Marinobacterium jannaschii]|uniref:FAD-dependent oxidoreductase n=1 Tax=Marinobacterium jannaschii TaxID=64970 RepID=UPI000AA599AD|nr:FAD-dependent oxidoreductase [Marinobacterium jannaschii]